MVWDGMRRAWAIAFVVTWFVVTAVLNGNGWSDNDSARMGVAVAAVVAVTVWFLVRMLNRRGAPPTEE